MHAAISAGTSPTSSTNARSVGPVSSSVAMYALSDSLPAVVVDLEDGRVLEARDGARLAREARARLLGAAQVRMHDLDGDPAIETRVAGAIHRRHPAMADLVRDFVAIDARKHGRNDPV